MDTKVCFLQEEEVSELAKIVVCVCGYVKTPNPSQYLVREEVRVFGKAFPPEGLVVKEKYYCEKCNPY